MLVLLRIHLTSPLCYTDRFTTIRPTQTILSYISKFILNVCFPPSLILLLTKCHSDEAITNLYLWASTVYPGARVGSPFRDVLVDSWGGSTCIASISFAHFIRLIRLLGQTSILSNDDSPTETLNTIPKIHPIQPPPQPHRRFPCVDHYHNNDLLHVLRNGNDHLPNLHGCPPNRQRHRLHLDPLFLPPPPPVLRRITNTSLLRLWNVLPLARS